jgi:hypothetical protein
MLSLLLITHTLAVTNAAVSGHAEQREALRKEVPMRCGTIMHQAELASW